MEDLTVLTTLNNLGSFVKRYVCLASISNFRKNKDVVHQPKLVRMGKLCPLSRVLRRRAHYFPIQASRLVNDI